MYCKNCGAKLPDDAKFCISCGYQVTPHQKTPKAAENKAKPETAKAVKTKSTAKKGPTQLTKNPKKASKSKLNTQQSQEEKNKLVKTMRTVFFVMAGLLAAAIVLVFVLVLFTNAFHNKSENTDLAELTSWKKTQNTDVFSADYGLAYLYPVDLLGVWEYEGSAEEARPTFAVYPDNRVNIILVNDEREPIAYFEETYKTYDDYIVIGENETTRIRLHRENDEMISSIYNADQDAELEFTYHKKDVSIETYKSYKDMETVLEVERKFIQFEVPEGQIPASDVLFNREWVFVGIADNNAIDSTGDNYSIENEDPDVYQSFYFYDDLTACRAILFEDGNLVWEIFYLEPFYEIGYKTEITMDQNRGLAFIIGDDNMLYACWYEYREDPNQPGTFYEFPMSDNMVFAPIELALDYGVGVRLFENGALAFGD